jgi:hypothetical protein
MYPSPTLTILFPLMYVTLAYFDYPVPFGLCNLSLL